MTFKDYAAELELNVGKSKLKAVAIVARTTKIGLLNSKNLVESCDFTKEGFGKRIVANLRKNHKEGYEKILSLKLPL